MVPITIVTWAYKSTYYNWWGHIVDISVSNPRSKKASIKWPPKMDPATGRHQIFGLLTCKNREDTKMVN